ncbi:aldolase/citrate lyase family protein [Amycolatopsis pithecellobii]|uniref:HpcH/HpaI aldolase/citrate lyase domain-containing protein n=1 Tax=Amycolatopsis pithecellobii TaxID=664692 RepID=A0A6N7YP92_9PSEU|nr:aldolase/citrate lyase family protein [Amycolatopsis pithecellobii]MTD53832.1 hypothetical protein [Amycolatopsis pithecellobii]
MRYPPAGFRSNGQVRRSYPSHRDSDEDVVCVVMIETVVGWKNADAIAAVPGVDVLILGPVDLALSMGWPVDTAGDQPHTLEAVHRLVEVAERHGKVADTFGFNEAHVQAVLERGMRWVTYNDFLYVADRQQYQSGNVASWKNRFTAVPGAEGEYP